MRSLAPPPTTVPPSPGLNANTLWYNLATAVVILIGRYPPIIFMMAVAGSLAAKQRCRHARHAAHGQLEVRNLLAWYQSRGGRAQFFPAFVLGPIAEFFAMKSGLLFLSQTPARRIANMNNPPNVSLHGTFPRRAPYFARELKAMALNCGVSPQSSR